jgi:hypothetical protein
MGGLTAAQFNSGEDEDVTRGIIAAQVYLRTNMKVAWDDPCEQLNIDDGVFKITDLKIGRCNSNPQLLFKMRQRKKLCC